LEFGKVREYRNQYKDNTMPNIGSAIREEITRLSRRESRSQVDPTRKATVKHRHEIAELKRQVAQLARQMALVSRKVLATPPAPAPSGPGAANGRRFVAKGLRTHRERLGLSQADFGRLLGVSAQTVYSWEREMSRPRVEQIAKIAAVRGLGKREAAARLTQLGSGNGKSRPTRRPRTSKGKP
jgi:DNA-binding XRE family transcriptional regulator